MGISSGRLRNKYIESLDNRILCRNNILMALSAMNCNENFSNEDKLLLAGILKGRNYTTEYMKKVIPQITEKYYPTDMQIKNLLAVAKSEYKYQDGYISDRYMKSVNRLELQSEDGRVLKQYIYDTEQIDIILDAIGCGNIEKNASGEYWSCSNWDGDNPNAIVVKNNPYIGVYNNTRGHEFDNKVGDIITLVRYNLRCGYKVAVKFIKAVLDNDLDSVRLREPKESNDAELETIIEEKTLSDTVLDIFEPSLHKSWIDEGITAEARAKFGICYFPCKQQIMIPHRRWSDGAIVGFNRRNTNEEWLLFGGSKYAITRGYRKGQHVYGYYENKQAIERAKCVCVFESEKSVVRRFANGDETAVATMGKNITRDQINIIKQLDVDEVVLAYDEDVKIDDLRWICEQFYMDGRKASYIVDSWGLLSEKQSPADLCNEDYKFLFDNRVVYDEKEHELYLESLNRE